MPIVKADTITTGSVVEVSGVFTVQDRFGLVAVDGDQVPIPESDFFFDNGDEFSFNFSYRIGSETIFETNLSFDITVFNLI